MVKCIGVIQARLTSIRLERKALLPLCGKPVIHHLFDRAQQIDGLSALVLAIPTGKANDPLEEIASTYPDIQVVRGPDDDLVTRFLMAADLTGAEYILRMWGDCPVTDPGLASGLLKVALEANIDWAHYPNDSGYPEGVESHVLKVSALRALSDQSDDLYERENIIPYLTKHSDRFQIMELRRKPDHNHMKVLLDTKHDYFRIHEIFDEIYPDNPSFTVHDLEQLDARRPELFDPTYRATALEFL